MESLIIIALDLSMNSTGYAVVEAGINRISLIKKDTIKAKGRENHGKKLQRQYNTLKVLHELYPNAVIVKESLHYGRAKTSAILAKVHGTVDLLFNEKIIYEYPAITVKKQITKNHKAGKQEVADAVRTILIEHGIIDVEFQTDDESDAVAVALTYLMSEEMV